MAYDPNLPANNSPIVSAELRNQFTGLKAIMDAGNVPVGCVLAYLKSFTGVPALPGSWVECNGQVLSDAASPLNGQTIPNLNGSGVGGIKRFLRGATASGATGGADSHSHGLDNLGNNPVTVSAGAGSQVVSADEASNTTTNADSSLPSHYEVVWVMRVK